MRLSLAVKEIIADELMGFQMRGPIPYGFGYFRQLADMLAERIEEQLAKEAAEGREKAA